MTLTSIKLALMDCEKGIEQGVASTAFALRKIRDERLYLEGWSSFEAYCRERWGWSRQRSHQLIEQADTIEAIEKAECQPMVDTLPTTERQVRPLASLPVEERAEAWQEAVEKAEKAKKSAPTGTIVAEVVEAKVGKSKRRAQSSAHPATFSKALLDEFAEILTDHEIERVLDPFGGTGLIHDLADRLEIDSVAVEIEPEWADMHERTITADSTTITRTMVGHFDAVVTSPAYGNRMADKHDAKDDSDRATYRHRLGHDLTEGNAGGMQWGDEYQALHLAVWKRTVKLLGSGGLFVLNVKDHIRDGKRIPVSAWHLRTLLDLGLTFVDDASIPSKGLGGGAGDNAEKRYGVEHVYVLTKS